MEKNQKNITTIDEYISQFPEHVQLILNELRTEIKKSAPNVKEGISYKMPSFYQHSVLVYFAAYKNHIGFYPTASGIAAFEKDLSEYKYSKGAIQFPIDKPLPFDLISKIVSFRVEDDFNKNLLKKASSKTKVK